MLKEIIELLANIAGIMGIFFFLYEYTKNKRESKENTKLKINEKLEAFRLTKKYIYMYALSDLDINKSELLLDKYSQLVLEDNYKNEDDAKLVALKLAFYQMELNIEGAHSDQDLTSIYPIKGLVSTEEYELAMSYIDSLNSLEQVLITYMNNLQEKSLMYLQVFSNSDIENLLIKIVRAKNMLEEKSFEANMLTTGMNSKLLLLTELTEQLIIEFNDATN